MMAVMMAVTVAGTRRLATTGRSGCTVLDKETRLFDEAVQFDGNYEHCYSAASCVVESSRVFHAVDSATFQVTHRCTPAPHGMLTALATHWIVLVFYALPP